MVVTVGLDDITQGGSTDRQKKSFVGYKHGNPVFKNQEEQEKETVKDAEKELHMKWD